MEWKQIKNTDHWIWSKGTSSRQPMTFFFHCINIWSLWGRSIVILDWTPVLLNEVEFTVIFGVKVTYMTSWCDVFLLMELLQTEIWLAKQNLARATVCVARNTFEPITLILESFIWPKATFTDDVLHALKPTRKFGVIIREIKILWDLIWSIHVPPIPHPGSSLCACPPVIGIFWHFSCW